MIAGFLAIMLALVAGIVTGLQDSEGSYENANGGGGNELFTLSSDGSTLTINGNISNNTIQLSEESWNKITSVVISNSVNDIASGALSKCVGVKTITAGYALKDAIPSIFGDSSYPDSLIRLIDGEYQHLILASIESTSGAISDCDKVKSVFICSDASIIDTDVFTSLAKSDCLASLIVDCPNLKSFGIKNNYPIGQAIGWYKLKTVEFRGTSIETIERGAFMNCSELVEVTLPVSLKIIEGNCFNGCKSLKNVNMQGSEKKDGLYIPSSVGYSFGVFSNCTSLEYAEVGNVGQQLFGKCVNLKKVVVGGNVTELEYMMFTDCVSLTEVVLPSTLIGLGQYPFINCTFLRELTLPASLTDLGNQSFKGCTSLERLNYEGNNFKYTNNGNQFDGCINFKQVFVVDGVLIYVPNPANGICEVPSGVREISTNAFGCCLDITKLILSSDVKTIGESAFAKCSQLEVVEGIRADISIGDKAFAGTAIKEAIIFDGTLYYGPAVSEYTIPLEVRHISDYAFCNNTHLTKVVFESTYGMTFGKNVFEGCTKLNNVVFKDGITFIPTGMFINCSSLNAIDLKGVTYIYANAFNGSGLESVVLPKTASIIETGAFRNCVNLTSVTIDNPNVQLRDYLFDGCTKLTTVNLPTNLKGIANYMFNKCTSLKSIVWPANLETIGNYAFSNTGLENIVIPESVKFVGKYAFYKCASVTDISIPASLADAYYTMGPNIFDTVGSKDTGINVTFEGSPSLTSDKSNNMFKNTKIATLYLKGSPDFWINDKTLKGCLGVNSIVVDGGTSFGYSQYPSCFPAIDSDGCIPAKLKIGDRLIDGRIVVKLTNPAVLTIPKDAVAVSSYVLNNMVRSIEVDSENPYYSYSDGTLYFMSENKNDSKLEDTTLVFVLRTGWNEDTVYRIQSGVKIIGTNAFSNDFTFAKAVVVPDSVEKISHLGLQAIRNILMDSENDLPLFDYAIKDINTIPERQSYVYYSLNMDESVIDSMVELKANGRSAVNFGGYFIKDGDSFTLLNAPLSSIDASVKKIGDKLFMTLVASDAFNKSAFTVKDGETVLTGIGGVYDLGDFVGVKVLNFEGLVMNTYSVASSSDASYSISFSTLVTSKILHGSEVMISITPNVGYSVGELVVKYGDTIIDMKMESGRYVGTIVVTKDAELTVSGISPEEEFTVLFNSDGGSSVDSQNVVSGHHASVPAIPSKGGSIFFGWFDGETLFDFTKGIVGDKILKAKWLPSDTPRYKITAGAANGTVTIFDKNLNKIVADGDEIVSGTTILLAFEPVKGYEVRSWKINDEIRNTISYSCETTVSANLSISVNCEYTISSFPYLETDIKTPSGSEGKMYWKIIGTKGYNGMVYTPAILGDYIYSWSDTEIFKIDLTTGELVDRVDTGVKTNALYYNMVTVGNGYVLAGYAGQVYDRDLNPVFRLYLDENTRSSELKTYYNEGYYYVFTESMIYKFKAEDEVPGENNIQYPIVTSPDTTKYTHYISYYQGQSNLIFTDRFIIGVEFDGREDENRYLVTYDIDTLEYIDSYHFTEIESANLNTGYISYYDGTVYFNTYSPGSNMFGTEDCDWNSLSSIELDSAGHFVPVTVHYYNIGATNYPSSLIVVGDYGYLNCENTFYVFDMKTMTIDKTVQSSMSHGNMAVSVQGDKVYAYVIPYGNQTNLYVFEHDQSTGVLSDKNMMNVIDVREYSSQLVHFGPHGELIYYNDSGYLFCVGFEYEVSFVTEGDAMDPIKFVPSKSLPLPEVTREGFIFEGWYDNDKFEGKKITSIPAGTYENVKLYAKFIEYSSITDKIISSVNIDSIVNGGESVIVSVNAKANSPEKVLLITYSAYMTVDGKKILNPFLKEHVELDNATNSYIFVSEDADRIQSISVVCWYKIGSIPFTTAYAESITPDISSTVDLTIDDRATLSFDGTAVSSGNSLEYGYYVPTVSGEEGATYMVNGVTADGNNRIFYYGQKLIVTKVD